MLSTISDRRHHRGFAIDIVTELKCVYVCSSVEDIVTFAAE